MLVVANFCGSGCLVSAAVCCWVFGANVFSNCGFEAHGFVDVFEAHIQGESDMATSLALFKSMRLRPAFESLCANIASLSSEVPIISSACCFYVVY